MAQVTSKFVMPEVVVTLNGDELEKIRLFLNYVGVVHETGADEGRLLLRNIIALAEDCPAVVHYFNTKYNRRITANRKDEQSEQIDEASGD